MEKRTALVTGAGGGLGHATVERLVADGWKVFAADINTDVLRSSMHDPDVVPIVMDVTDRESLESAYNAIVSQTDHLDGVVNFAGVMGLGSLTDMPEERLARILDINVMGTFRVNKIFFPLVEASKGRIVNISSETGWQSAAPFNGPYSMSKYAIEAYSTALRRELALLGVKVITIQPGPFRTDMVEGIERAFTQAENETTKFASVIRQGTGCQADQFSPRSRHPRTSGRKRPHLQTPQARLFGQGRPPAFNPRKASTANHRSGVSDGLAARR